MRLKLNVSLLPFLLYGSTAFCQQSNVDALDAFSGTFLKKIKADKGEKAYLTTNKTIYASGEAVWFRAFLVHSFSEKISTQSGSLLVELVDEKDSVWTRSILNAREQQTDGKLVLPEALPTGNYWVRAYTSSISHGEPQNAAVAPVYLINLVNPAPVHVGAKSLNSAAGEQQVRIDMFPEGGSLVTGLNTTLGLYLHDKNGNPLPVSGSIKDSRDSVVATFTANKLGLTKADFFPYVHRKYKAVLTYKEKEYSFPLPPFNRYAGQLSVAGVSGKTLKLRTVLEDSIYRKDAVTYLLGVAKDSLCFASIGYGSYETDVQTTVLPKGITTFLLFDQNFNLLSERRYYVKEGNLKVAAGLDKTTYARRTQATLSTTVSTTDNRPLTASVTVAVSNSDAVIAPEALMGNSLVQKAIETGITNWDLAHLTALSEEDIDLLLLSSRPFYTNRKMEPGQTATSVTERFFDINGRLLTAKGSPVPNEALTLLSKAGNGIFAMDTTDAAGQFSFPLSAYMDSTQFIIQVNATKNKVEKPRIELAATSFPPFQTPAFLKQGVIVSPAQRAAFLRHHADTTLAAGGTGWLNPVSLQSQSKPYAEDARRISSTGSVLTSEQLVKLGMGNIGIGLLRMPGVQLINGFVAFYGPDRFAGVTASSEPLVFMDGIQVSLPAGEGAASSPVIQFLNTLNPREIDFIEVLKGSDASMYGLRGGTGVIQIHSSSKIHQDFVTTEGNVYKFYRQGYAKPALFPLDSYNQKSSNDPSFADRRFALYWNGNELATGQFTFSFFTNDIPGHYEVMITGITENGDLVYKTLPFTNK